MATEIAEAYVALHTKMSGVEGEVAKGLGAADGEFDRAAKRQGGIFGKIVGGSMLGSLGASAIQGAVSGIVGYLGESIQSFKDAEAAQVQLTDAYARFPSVTSVSIDSLRALNTELMNKTRFDDDALASGQATLAQYNLTGEQLQQLTPLLADYAAKTGVDVTTAADQLGKAMLGQGRALKGVGIDFQDTGSVAGNFEQVMAGLTTQVGGFAETEGASAAGTAERMKNAFGELQETVGGALLPRIVEFQQFFLEHVMPVLADGAGFIADVLGPGLDSLGELFAGLDFGALGELMGYMSPLGVVFKILQPVLPMIADAFGQVFSIIGDAVMSILPTLLPVFSQLVAMLSILAANVIPLLLPIIIMLAETFATLLEAVMPIVSALLDALMPILGALIPVILTILEAFLPLVTLLIDALLPIFVMIADMLLAVLVPVLQTVVGVIKWLAEIVKWAISEIIAPFFMNVLLPIIQKVAQGFMIAFGGLGDFFADLWRGIERTFKGFINFIIDGINGFIGGLNEMGNFLSDATGGAIDFNIGRIPRLAEGGVVPASPGGSLAVIGEGRYDEVVLPLSPEVLSQIGGGGGLRPGQPVVLVIDGREFDGYVKSQGAEVVQAVVSPLTKGGRR